MKPVNPAKLAALIKVAKDGYVAREIERREEERWLATDNSGLSLLVGLLGRLQDEFERAETAGGTEPDSTEAAEAVSKFGEMIAEINGLIETLEVLSARDEDEEAGVQHQCVVAPMVASRS